MKTRAEIIAELRHQRQDLSPLLERDETLLDCIALLQDLVARLRRRSKMPSDLVTCAHVDGAVEAIKQRFLL